VTTRGNFSCDRDLSHVTPPSDRCLSEENELVFLPFCSSSLAVFLPMSERPRFPSVLSLSDPKVSGTAEEAKLWFASQSSLRVVSSLH
jgi:hypothetical protein